MNQLNALLFKKSGGFPIQKDDYKILVPRIIYIRRIISLFLSILSLFFSIPLILVISTLIKLETPGPIFFIQKRMGKNGELFNLYKFRTMYINSEDLLETLLTANDQYYAEYKVFHKIKLDPRITPLGRILRKTSLDELPQILNILLGDMNFVGPRAYLPSEKNKMAGHNNIIHKVTPGLTGWWQVMGRNNISFQKRLELDVYYIRNFTFWLDFYIFMKTFTMIFTGNGV
ncbi:MAG: hypothetical protein HOB05_12745 [Bacteroidetes bacterium]|nr:hypothetical protein [Bacteroidota bacterium]